MGLTVTPQKIYQKLKDLPEDSLNEVWNFIEFIRVKYKKKSPDRVVKLGGILADYKIDITEKDITEARIELWNNLGGINE